MTPEEVLGALVTHSQSLDFGKPDPLVIAASVGKTGRIRPRNWRLIIGRKNADDKVEIWPGTRTALGSQTHRASKFSVSEVAADALIGMYERNWHTLQIAIGVGDAVRPLLCNRLRRVARRMKKDERVWPDSVSRRNCFCGHSPAIDYIPDLVELAVRHLEDPFLFKTHRVRYEWFSMSETQWHAKMRQPYDAVSAHVWAWYHAGIGHIQNRIIQRNRNLAHT